MSLFKSLFIEHPASAGETYWEHLLTALGFGATMLVAGVACMIHGLVPAAFVTRGSDAVCALHERMLARRRLSARSPHLS
ncbi:MAG: DUF6356 family protein [Steroidobacteraceae bacterium]|jgi:hypothetical protein